MRIIPTDRRVEKLWDCPSCHRTGIGASNRVCPYCSAPRTSDIITYLPGHAKVGDRIPSNVKQVKVSDLPSTEPDWYCDFCGQYNTANRTVCVGCGASKHKDTKNYAEINKGRVPLSKSALQSIRHPVESSKSASSAEHDDSDDDKDSKLQTPNPSSSSSGYHNSYTESSSRSAFGSGYSSSRFGSYRPFASAHRYKTFGQSISSWWSNGGSSIIGVCAIVLAVIGLIVGLVLFFSTETTVTVQEKDWKCTVDIEKYTLCHENGWSVPNGATVTKEQQEIHHYIQVIDHYKTVQKSETYISGYRTVQKSESYISGYRTYEVYGPDDGNGYAQVDIVEEPIYDIRYWTEEEPIYDTRYWTEEEPVYRDEPVKQTKYYYDIWRWKYDRTVQKSGKFPEIPSYPTLDLTDKERIDSKHAYFWVIVLMDDETTKEYTTTQQIWNDIEIGNELIVLKHSNEITELKFKNDE